MGRDQPRGRVLAWLENEEPATTVEGLLDAARPVMSWINVREVAYITHRSRDEALTRQQLQRLPRTFDRRVVHGRLPLARGGCDVSTVHSLKVARHPSERVMPGKRWGWR